MKSFLVVAGLLMTGASVYGVVDYNKKVESKEFKELYKEKFVPDEVEATEEIRVPKVQKKEMSKGEAVHKKEGTPVKEVAKKKTVKKKKERILRLKEFSRGRME